jgi:hypothetical protein
MTLRECPERYTTDCAIGVSLKERKLGREQSERFGFRPT